jgi:hypothetical protein
MHSAMKIIHLLEGTHPTPLSIFPSNVTNNISKPTQKQTPKQEKTKQNN